MTSDFDITITRKCNIIEIVGTGVSVNFYPKDKEKTLNGILDKCNEFNLLSPADEHFKDAKHELEIQLTQIYEEYQNKGTDSSKDQNDKDNRKSIYLHKYSTGIKSLAEAIILGQKPLFLQIVDGKPFLVDKIESYDRILYPKESNSYSSEPYVFESIEEIKDYINLAKKITNFNQIFRIVKTTFQKYVDAEDHYIIILAADTIYSYFQDKFATTHYLICVGDNSSGKNSILMTFANLGYRTLLATSVSAANVYTYLGSTEDCQGTIAEDEINNLDNDPDKMNIHKSGYSRSSGKVPKIDLHSGRVQEVFLTYCFKMFASEKSLDSSKAKGILDRSFIIRCIAGRPQYNIKDVFEKSNDMTHTKLRKELDKIRKLLLVYRLLHYEDTIKDVKLNIYNREAELTKPLIRLFRESPEVLQELLSALSKLLDDKRKVRSNSLEAKLYTAIRNLIPYHGYVIDHASIIEELRQITHGEETNGQQAFYSTDLGKITHRSIVNILVDKFKAERTSKGSGNEKKRALHFIEQDLIRKDGEYNVPDKIEILPDNLLIQNISNEPDSFDTVFLESTSNIEKESVIQVNSGTEGTQGTHLGDKEVENQVSTSIITMDQLNKFENNIRNLLKNNEQNSQANPSNNDENMSTYPIIPSQASQSSHFLALQVKNEKTKTAIGVIESIYRLGHSDTFACHNCKQKGDKWYMKQHICRGSKRENE